MLTIEDATSQQAPAIEALIRRNALATYAAVAEPQQTSQWLDGLHSLTHIQQRIDDPDSLQLVLLDDEQIVGVASVSLTDACSHLGALYLEPAVRGQGWGPRLLDERLAWSRLRQATEATTTVSSHNVRMKSILQSYGFALHSQEDGILMPRVVWQKFALVL